MFWLENSLAASDALVKIDMSEFGEHHTVSRLVGAPAGYVGYDEGGQLTDKIRRHPYSLVLFDEIEKAHIPKSSTCCFNILEDGVLTDAKGRKIDFTNTIVIMTSNLGAQKLQKEAGFGFQATSPDELKDLDALHARNKSKVQDELKKMMRPELLNRIDKTIVFRALTKKDALRILDLQIDELRQRLIKHGIGLEVTPSAKQHILDEGYDALNGVRPLRRLLQDTIEDHIALEMLDNKYDKGHIVQVGLKNSQLAYTAVSEITCYTRGQMQRSSRIVSLVGQTLLLVGVFAIVWTHRGMRSYDWARDLRDYTPPSAVVSSG